jgi:hypothetical protein
MDERIERKRGTTKYEHSSLLYADDAALFVNSRANLDSGANCLSGNLLMFGVMMHIGAGGTPLATKAMYFPTSSRRGFTFSMI